MSIQLIYFTEKSDFSCRELLCIYKWSFFLCNSSFIWNSSFTKRVEEMGMARGRS